MNLVSPAFSSPKVRWAAALLMAPFFLQLLGMGDTFLGGGLCGELFGNEIPFGLQGAGFWYAVMFMMLLGFQLMYGAFLLLTRLLEMPDSMERGTYLSGIWLVGIITLLFILTRTTGLPTPSPQGLALGETAPVDPLSLILIGCSWAGALLLWRLLGKS
jgi:amino acid permease